VSGTSDDIGDRAPHPRALLVVGLVILASFALAGLALVTALPHYHIERVEVISGGIATVEVPDLDAEYSAEVVDPDLEPGAEVVTYVADDVVSIVSTSPRGVALVTTLKDLL